MYICGLVCHVLNRSVGRATIFHDASDYAAFEDLLLGAGALTSVPLPFWKYHVRMMNQPSDEPSFPRLRPSVSHNASRQAEIVRVRRMTVEERVKAALGLGRRFASLQPAPARRDQ